MLERLGVSTRPVDRKIKNVAALGAGPRDLIDTCKGHAAGAFQAEIVVI
ncbi:MAG TPA: hypothetical protein VFZ10_13695 [Geminicoccaceae bacterium]